MNTVYENGMNTQPDMDKETKAVVIRRLRQEGCRITHQREQILDVILQEECATVKEIYTKAKRMDTSVGFATVYRMISLLEQTGLISRGIIFNYDEVERLKREDKG